MKAFSLAALVTLSVALPGASAPEPQTPQTPGSQIQIVDCNPHLHSQAESHPWIDPYGVTHYTHVGFPYWDAFLGIVFVNKASQSATEIDFGLVSRGSLIAVAKDAGKFSPEVPIDHEFVVSREIFPIGTAVPYCAVLRVKYADGSTWENPTPPQP